MTLTVVIRLLSPFNFLIKFVTRDPLSKISVSPRMNESRKSRNIFFCTIKSRRGTQVLESELIN